jgi:ATP-dependent DNA helicase DinG
MVTAARKIMAVDQLRTLTDLDAKAQELGLLLGARSGQRVLEEGGDEDLRRCLVQLEGLVRAVLESVKSDGEAIVGTMKQQQVVGAATHLVGDLQRFISCGDDEVAWVSDDGRRPILFLSPIDLGPTLGATLWGDITAVLTSATIPANLAARLGIPRDQVDELDVGSPFDYKSNSLLYVAKHLPDRRDPSAEPAICSELAQLITAAGGRTLALFTSRKFMLEAAEAVRAAVEVTVLVQGDLPKNRLLEQFRANPSTCLFATMGFWQGVDLPGETLSLVTIDRLPFGRPDDPLLNARRERAGDRAFMVVDVPRAAALLAQGAGRLIRTATDRGVVAVFDSRLATARYREALLAELPPMKRTITLSDVTAFLESIRDA